MKPRLLAGASVALPLFLALAATPAVADVRHVTLSPVAGLQARGAGLVVGVTVQCDYYYGNEAQTRVALSQRGPDGAVRQWSGYATSPCDGAPHTRRVPVHAVGSPFGWSPVAATAVTSVPGSDPVVRSATLHVRSRVLDQAYAFVPDFLEFALVRDVDVLAAGAGAAARLRYTCSSTRGGAPPFVLATLTQRTSARVATSGATGQSLTCDREEHVMRVVFHAYDLPVHTGAAFLTLEAVGSCATQGLCYGVPVHRTVMVRAAAAAPG